MAARYSYSNPYQVDQLAMYQYEHQMMAQSGPRRFFSAIGRFIYRLIVLTLVVAAVGGVLFALYRNGILHTIARGAGIETQFRSFEKTVGAERWGAPPTVEPPPDSIELAAAAAADAKDPSEKPAEEAKTATGVAIVSFDSLPTTGKKAAAETVAASAPAEEPKARPAPMTIAQAAAAPRQERKPAKAEPPKPAKPAKPAELTRSIPLPKAPPKAEPVAKAEPEPKPEPPAPKPEPEVDRTKPRAGDNPLKAAIREAMAAKKKE
jgi:hypothetical protein